MGYILSRDGISTDPEKITAISNWPTPTTVPRLQSFLGFANFYRKLIFQYSKIIKPLTSLLKKNVPFIWSTDCQVAFPTVQQKLTDAPLLRYFDSDKQCILETAASGYAVAAILSQRHPDGVHPISYVSKFLSPAEQNYDIYDRELLAIVLAFKTWRHYLEGSSQLIRVLTDHLNLTWFSTTKQLNRRQARWYLELPSYRFQI